MSWFVIRKDRRNNREVFEKRKWEGGKVKKRKVPGKQQASESKREKRNKAMNLTCRELLFIGVCKDTSSKEKIIRLTDWRYRKRR